MTHILTIEPSDVLFFRDGRPMDGASIGHGAAWPMPHILDSAIHHALHRAELTNLHSHTPKRSGVNLTDNKDEDRTRHFGSLQTAGTFPVLDGTWYFPRPADADEKATALTTHKPLKEKFPGTASSLDAKLTPVVNTQPPSKDKAEPWLSKKAFEAYLHNAEANAPEPFLNDEKIFAAEHNIGIGIDPNTGTQDGKSFYSAAYLRLQPTAKLGLIAKCQDKDAGDLIDTVFPNSGSTTNILAGGQQRTCGVLRTTPNNQAALPLPIGQEITGKLVRWTLLTPAIFPHIKEDTDKGINDHPGGWLPSWIDPSTMEIKLKNRPSRKNKEPRADWRARVKAEPFIGAKLTSAIIPRAIPITGWATHDTDDQSGKLITTGGARATHLAVPAGAVYYFEADTEEEAKKLAAALNWHGDPSTPTATEIINRRSSLMGEKGFGLGVCSPFSYHQ